MPAVGTDHTIVERGGVLYKVPLSEVAALTGVGGPMTTFISQPTGTVSVTTTAEIELATVAVSAGASNRKLLILANANFTKDTGTTVRATSMRLRQGTNNSGTLLKEAASSSGNIASIPFGTATIAFLHEPGAGATNYRISAVNFASATVTANNISIQVIDLTGAKGDPGPPGGGLLATIVDEKASGTNGGDSTTSYSTRTLNTVAFDPDGILTLSSNTFTSDIDCGVTWSAPGCSSIGAYHKTRLVRVSDSSVIAVGSSELVFGGSRSVGSARILAGVAYRVEQQSSAVETNGLGIAVNFGDPEIYTIVNLWS